MVLYGYEMYILMVRTQLYREMKSFSSHGHLIFIFTKKNVDIFPFALYKHVF